MSAPRINKHWYWLLLLPYAAALWLPSYNRVEPALFGLPFFYWYQLLWVILTSPLVAFVFKCAHRTGKR